MGDLVEAAHVARHAGGVDPVGTQAFDGLLQRRHLDIGDDDARAPGAQLPRHREADPAGATRDDRATTLDTVHRRTLRERPRCRSGPSPGGAVPFLVMALIDPSLLPLVAEQRAHNARLMEITASMAAVDTSTPDGVRWLRTAMEPGGLFGMTSLDFPEVRDIPGPAGPVPIRVLRPERVDGVYLHFHGGGMTVGSAAAMDGRNWPLANATGLAVVSVDYRLAPEHPFPAGPDDCEAAALWLAEHAAEEFGTDRLLVGGESAGGYLALLTMVRLRDRFGGRPPFLGADLCYGVYDLGGTPSATLTIGKVPYAAREDTNRAHYLPGRSKEEARSPAVSPLWAELHDLPPCLLTVGTADFLLDDSLFLAGRLAAAGNDVELAVYPEGPHGIEGAPTEMGRTARERVYAFLRARLAAGAVTLR